MKLYNFHKTLKKKSVLYKIYILLYVILLLGVMEHGL